MTPIHLTPGQQRHLYAALLSYEKALRLAGRLLKEDTESGILFFRRPTLNDRQRQDAAEKIERSLRQLADFVNLLGLEPKEELAGRVIASYIGESWTGLEDCRSKNLENYGALDAVDAEAIDHSIRQLSHAALDLGSLFAVEAEESAKRDLSRG